MFSTAVHFFPFMNFNKHFITVTCHLNISQGTDMLVLPLVILGVVSVIGGVLGLRLPETLHHHLPQTIEEGEEFGKDWTLNECLRCIPIRHVT